MIILSAVFIWVVLVHAKSSSPRMPRFLLGTTSSSSPAANPLSNLTGCTFQARPEDTLHSLAKAFNVSMDHLAAINPTSDLSDPVVLQSTGVVNIPCPGSKYKTFMPLNIAGCFFLFTIDAAHPSMQSLLISPPDSIPGPLSLTSIWIANYQALPYSIDGSGPPASKPGTAPRPSGIDLTAPGEWKVGRVIFVPTCYHGGTIIDFIPVSRPKTGCKINIVELGDVTIEALALGLGVSASDLAARNAWKEAKGQLPSPLVSIPCP